VIEVFGKIITAMVTPFDQDDNIHLFELKKLVNHLIKTKSSCLFVSSTIGEEPTLTDLEKLVLYEKTVEYVNGRVGVLAGINGNSTTKTIETIKKIDHINLSGYIITVPSLNQPNEIGISQHYKKVAKATKKPIIIDYHTPNTTLSVETILELARMENIVGIIVYDDETIKLLKNGLPKSFNVYVGRDVILFDALKNQADGVVSIASQLYGNSIHNIISLMRAELLKDAEALFAIYQSKFQKLENLVHVKVALNKLAFNVGSVRLPLVDIEEQNKCELYKNLGI
jgi:4-hydroxy-tetrahydrodipicolinate synthase